MMASWQAGWPVGVNICWTGYPSPFSVHSPFQWGRQGRVNLLHFAQRGGGVLHEVFLGTSDLCKSGITVHY